MQSQTNQLLVFHNFCQFQACITLGASKQREKNPLDTQGKLAYPDSSFHKLKNRILLKF